MLGVILLLTIIPISGAGDIPLHGYIKVGYSDGEESIVPFTIHFNLSFPIIDVELVDKNDSEVNAANNMVFEFYKQKIKIYSNGDALVSTATKLYFEKFYRINKSSNNVSGIVVGNYSVSPIPIGSLKIKNSAILIRNCIIDSKGIKEIKNISLKYEKAPVNWTTTIIPTRYIMNTS